MTLILIVGDAPGVYQSSDYQLTDQGTGAPTTDRAGSKQLQADFQHFNLGLAFTGIAAVGGGSKRQRTIDWLSAELKALPHDSDLQDICEVLARRSSEITKPHGARGILELILTVGAIGKPFRVAVISNVDWGKRPPEAKPEFSIMVHTITKPFHLISGYRDCVPALQEHRLRALARDIGDSQTNIFDAMADINAIAARHSRGYVSEGCWVTSQIADGSVIRSASRNVGQHPGDIPLLVGGFNISEWVKKNFRAEPGKEIRLVQSAGVKSGPGSGTPLPVPTGDPRSFILSGSSVSGSLRSPEGVPCASVEITQLECVLEMKCNQEYTAPFATVALSGVSPLGRAFPKPLLPWPQLRPTMKIDEAAVPRGWEYSVGYWIEDGTHHVVIPQSSRSIRNVSFLGPEDEIVVVAPSTTMEFAWGEREEVPPATVYATVSWRSRLDGTRG